MAAIKVRMMGGTDRYFDFTGSGTLADPYRINNELVDSSGDPLSTEHSALSVSTNEHCTTTTEEYTESSGSISAAHIAPASGNSLGVFSFSIRTDGNSGVISLDFATSGIKVGKIYVAKESMSASGEIHIEGAVDEVLTITASGLGTGEVVFVTTNTVEH